MFDLWTLFVSVASQNNIWLKTTVNPHRPQQRLRRVIYIAIKYKLFHVKSFE